MFTEKRGHRPKSGAKKESGGSGPRKEFGSRTTKQAGNGSNAGSRKPEAQVRSSSKIEWKAGTILAPVPAVLVTCSAGGRDNVFTVAWTGIVNTSPAMTYLSIRRERFSHELIAKSKEFAINLTTAALVRTADFCGVKSGRDIDKFEVCGLEKAEARRIGCPILAASPVTLECRVRSVTQLGTHDMFLAEILCVDVEASLIDGNGKLRLDRADLAAYAHGDYFALGRKLGSFGFSVRKKLT